MSRPKPGSPALSLFEQIKTALDHIVPLAVRAEAEAEFLGVDFVDQRSVNAAGLRAIQRFADFFADELGHRPEITPEAIRDAAIHMFLGVVERFKQAALMQAAGLSPNNVAPDAEIIRH